MLLKYKGIKLTHDKIPGLNLKTRLDNRLNFLTSVQ